MVTSTVPRVGQGGQLADYLGVRGSREGGDTTERDVCVFLYRRHPRQERPTPFIFGPILFGPSRVPGVPIHHHHPFIVSSPTKAGVWRP